MTPALAPDSIARLRRDSLSTTWLAARLGIEPERIESMRRSGELLGVRVPGSRDYLFPLWQLDRHGRPLPWVPRVLETARESGIGTERLVEILSMRSGSLGGRRIVELLRAGDEEYVLGVVRSARP